LVGDFFLFRIYACCYLWQAFASLIANRSLSLGFPLVVDTDLSYYYECVFREDGALWCDDQGRMDGWARSLRFLVLDMIHTSWFDIEVHLSSTKDIAL
jgi:hypothetical protein